MSWQRSGHRSGLVGLRRLRGWELHPGVRSGGRLGRGERAADLARDRLGSWVVTLVGAATSAAGLALALSGDPGGPVAALGLLVCGMVLVDLSLVLLCLRRADDTASELALYELESDRRAAAVFAELRDEVDLLRGDVARFTARRQTTGQTDQMGAP